MQRSIKLAFVDKLNLPRLCCTHATLQGSDRGVDLRVRADLWPTAGSSHLPPSLWTSLCRLLLLAPPDVFHQEVVLWLLEPPSTPSSAPLHSDNSIRFLLHCSSTSLQLCWSLRLFTLQINVCLCKNTSPEKGRVRERRRQSWCETGVGWEGLEKHQKHRPLTSPWEWWGCDLSIIYIQHTRTHHTHTKLHYACSHTCWWGLWLCDERRHGRVWIQPVAEHVWRSEVKDGPRESTHLWIDGRKRKNYRNVHKTYINVCSFKKTYCELDISLTNDI